MKQKPYVKKICNYILNGKLDIFDKKLLIREYYIQSKSLDKKFQNKSS